MTLQLKNILVPVDFSKQSINALTNAADLSLKINAKLEIMHVYHMIASGGDTALFVNQAIIENQRVLVADKLKAMVEEIPMLENVNFTFNIEYGQTSNMILKRLEKDDIDLVIVGAKGQGGILEKLIGSTTYDLMNSANVPVMAIPENVKKLKWDQVILAFDKSRINLESFKNWIEYLNRKFKSHFEIVHVSEPNKPSEDNMVDFKTYFEDIPYHSSEILGASTEKRLFQFIKDSTSDMIIVFPRKDHIFTHLFSKSITKSLMEKLHIPLLAFHVDDKVHT